MRTRVILGICMVLPTVCIAISSRCLSLMQTCISPELCRREQTLLRNVCGSEDSSCHAQSSEGCNVTIRAILGHSKECTCTGENPCDILQLLASVCSSYTDGEDSHESDPPRSPTRHPGRHADGPRLDRPRPSTVHGNNPKEEWQISSLLSHAPAPNVSCVQEMTLCIRDEVCNRQLVPFVQSCSSPRCEENLCRLAAKGFYSNLPENVAEMLVFCQCEPEDKDCKNFQTMLNSNSCKQDHSAQWNCLEMLDNCTGEKICRKTFEAFLSKCFDLDLPFAEYSTTDLLHVIDPDFFVVGNKECRMAVVATMGSVLQSPCTCHGVAHHHLYRCNVLRQAIQNRSYFRPKGHKQLISSTKSIAKPSQQGHILLNDHLLYVVVCVCVVVMAVIIAVTVTIVKHKQRKKRRLPKNPDSRFHLPEDSSKSLINP